MWKDVYELHVPSWPAQRRETAIGCQLERCYRWGWCSALEHWFSASGTDMPFVRCNKEVGYENCFVQSLLWMPTQTNLVPGYNWSTLIWSPSLMGRGSSLGIDTGRETVNLKCSWVLKSDKKGFCRLAQRLAVCYSPLWIGECTSDCSKVVDGT